MMYKDAKDRDNVHTHARMHACCRGRRRVGRREATRGEDNVRRVLSCHIFGCCSFSVFPGRWVVLYWNMNTVGIQNQSVLYIYYIHFTAC